MLVLSDEHIKRLEEIFEKIERFEDNYNRNPNHYPSTIWNDISRFKHEVNEYNQKGFYLSNLK